MSIDYAHTPTANDRRQAKATAIARWCYRRGVTVKHLRATNAATRRRLALQINVPPPREQPGINQLGETWELSIELLEQRTNWDNNHQLDPPAAPIDCLGCLLSDCPTHTTARTCISCGQVLHPVTVTEGYATHPTCHVSRPTIVSPGQVVTDVSMF